MRGLTPEELFVLRAGAGTNIDSHLETVERLLARGLLYQRDTLVKIDGRWFVEYANTANASLLLRIYSLLEVR